MDTVRKRHLLDTNILMRDPKALYAFKEHDVYISLAVLKELDKHKEGMEEHNINARITNTLLDKLQEVGQQKIPLQPSQNTYWTSPPGGIPLSTDGSLGRLYFVVPPRGKETDYADPELLDYLRQETENYPENPPILITGDVSLRVQAKALGLEAQIYRHGRDIKNLHELLDIMESIDLPEQARERLKKSNSATVPSSDFSPPETLFNNQYIYGAGMLLQYRRESGGHEFHRLDESKRDKGIYGIKPKNKEQHYLLDLCLNEHLRIGTVLGMAGTGKTIVPLAAALQLVLKDKKYDEILVIRPLAEIGEKIGFIKGGIEAKVAPHMRPIRDVVEIIFQQRENHGHKSLDDLIKQGKFSMEPMTYMRGRNVAKRYIIVDEAQNLTQEQAKTLATRTGEQSKIIFTGDPYQIDLPHIDETSNGLVALTKRLRGEKIFSTVILKKTERSNVAELVARKM